MIGMLALMGWFVNKGCGVFIPHPGPPLRRGGEQRENFPLWVWGVFVVSPPAKGEIEEGV